MNAERLSRMTYIWRVETEKTVPWDYQEGEHVTCKPYACLGDGTIDVRTDSSGVAWRRTCKEGMDTSHI